MGEITISQRSFDKIIFFEITSEALYNKKYRAPHWPGEQSGITLGIGFDLGYHSQAEFYAAWGEHLPAEVMERLKKALGIKGLEAKKILPNFKDIQIPLDKAKIVHLHYSLPKAAKSLLAYEPKVVELFPDAQGGLLSLVFNRGNGTQDKPGSTRRREMKAIPPLIRAKDYNGIAKQIESMKRLWPQGSGLIPRRTDEAALVRNSDRQYTQNELIIL